MYLYAFPSDNISPFIAKIVFVFLTVVFLLLVSASFRSAQVSAQVPPTEGTLIFQDDFSQGFEKWQLIAGDWSMWQIVGEGDQAQALVETGATITQLIPKDDFWPASPLLNYEYRFEYQPLAGADRNVGFGYRDSGNWCEIHFVGGIYQMICKNNGVLTLNVKENFTLPNGPKYQFTLRFENGRIRVWIDDFLLKDVVDTGFNGQAGRPLLRAGTGSIAPTQVRFDTIRVYDLDTQDPPFPTPLPVSNLSQLDPSWVEDEYDTASLWSQNPTVGRWGCAITSMTMILQYYGLNTFPAYLDFGENGEVQVLDEIAAQEHVPVPVTPKTLNSWLKSQPDGYIGEGLVNWWAVTRLTREISESGDQNNPLPKLEYQRVPVVYPDPESVGYDQEQVFLQSLLTAQNEILQEKPVILEIPGHFVVGNGLVETEDLENPGEKIPSDLAILDPYFDSTLLSQHRTLEAPLPLISTRIFTPSYTDLSAIVVVHDPALVVHLLDGNGEIVSGEAQPVQTFFEQITDQQSLVAGSQESTPAKLITELSKPITGEYQLLISSLEPGFYDFQVYSYDQLANPSIFTFSDWFSGSENDDFFSRKYVLSFDKVLPTTLQKVTTWDTLFKDIDILFQVKQIDSWYVWDELAQVGLYIHDFLGQDPVPDISTAEEAQLRYLSLLEWLFDWYRSSMTETAHLYLVAELRNIRTRLVLPEK